MHCNGELMKKIIAILIVLIVSGCAMVHKGPSVCSNPDVARSSWLCEAAAKTGYPLEEFGYIILDAESVGIITEKITEDQVKDFCNVMRAILLSAQHLTYSRLIDAVFENARDRAIASLVSRRLIIFKSDLTVSNTDIGFLLWQLDRIEEQV